MGEVQGVAAVASDELQHALGPTSVEDRAGVNGDAEGYSPSRCTHKPMTGLADQLPDERLASPGDDLLLSP
ncbi:hypothetical protein [Streptomyces natalensis]|uniref:hypothetical protein n=1 Tax=Streptomyces natalensis TaxID=68242 RepID=UPI0012FEB746|nr:hypothetical protein [Streptomyces natalensis]